MYSRPIVKHIEPRPSWLIPLHALCLSLSSISSLHHPIMSVPVPVSSRASRGQWPIEIACTPLIASHLPLRKLYAHSGLVLRCEDSAVKVRPCQDLLDLTSLALHEA